MFTIDSVNPLLYAAAMWLFMIDHAAGKLTKIDNSIRILLKTKQNTLL